MKYSHDHRLYLLLTEALQTRAARYLFRIFSFSLAFLQKQVELGAGPCCEIIIRSLLGETASSRPIKKGRTKVPTSGANPSAGTCSWTRKECPFECPLEGPQQGPHGARKPVSGHTPEGGAR